MKKTLSIIRAILPHLIVFAIILAPSMVFAATPAATGNAPAAFVPLNPIPGVFDVANAPTLPAFFNGLYKICIGAAATIAVLQIMRAGFMFMVNKGSVSHNEEAKSLITNSVLGLVLVLSPAIVFGIINPKILSLNLDVSSLQPLTASTTPFTGTDTTLWVSSGDKVADAARCSGSGGTIVYTCAAPAASGTGATARAIGATEQCKTGETALNTCKAPTGAPTTDASCTANYSNITAVPDNGVNKCSATKGYVGVPNGCCTGASASTLCCAQPKTQYVLAYTYSQTKSGQAACRVNAPVDYFVDEASCKSALSVASNLPLSTQSVTYSNLNVVKSCVTTDDLSYKIPDDTQPALCK